MLLNLIENALIAALALLACHIAVHHRPEGSAVSLLLLLGFPTVFNHPQQETGANPPDKGKPNDHDC